MTRALILTGALLFSAIIHAQTPAATPAASQNPALVLSATSANVKESGTPVKIRIFRWSTDAERAAVVDALTAPPPAPPREGGRGARGNAGGRAGGRGRGGAPAAPQTPIERFTAAVQKTPTVGYIWTSDVTGYSIKYAWHAAQPDGTDRVVLVTDRRLGAYSPEWTLTSGGTPTEYEFTLLELHVDAKGGEGKATLTTPLAADAQAKLLSLENYTNAPAVLQNVKRAAN